MGIHGTLCPGSESSTGSGAAVGTASVTVASGVALTVGVAEGVSAGGVGLDSSSSRIPGATSSGLLSLVAVGVSVATVVVVAVGVIDGGGVHSGRGVGAHGVPGVTVAPLSSAGASRTGT